MPRRIGLISDTHGLLRPEALAALRGAELILHAGDIGRPEVLDGLRELAPVVAVRGNVDRGAWMETLPERETVWFEGLGIHLLHNLAEWPPEFMPGVAAVVSGHSHSPRLLERNGMLYLNPGSAGPRRFKLPVAVGWLELEAGRLRGGIVELEVS